MRTHASLRVVSSRPANQKEDDRAEQGTEVTDSAVDSISNAQMPTALLEMPVVAAAERTLQ